MGFSFHYAMYVSFEMKYNLLLPKLLLTGNCCECSSFFRVFQAFLGFQGLMGYQDKR